LLKYVSHERYVYGAIAMCSDKTDTRQAQRAPSEFCIVGIGIVAVGISMPDVIEDCGCCGPSASDVSQRVGATSRSRLSGGRASNIDFQNLPVTGLLAPPSRFAGIVHEDLLFTSHRSGRSGDISSLSPRSCSPMQPLIIPKHRDTSRSCPIYIHPRVVNRSNNVTHVRTDYVSWR
jgi:hypothetical protein